MKDLSKRKIVAGYTLMLAALLFSLFFVQREVETLSRTNDHDLLLTDSLLALLRQKDSNTIRLLRTLSEAGEGMISTDDIEQIIAQEDSVVTRQRVQHRIITSRDTLVTPPRKKGFFRRLGEAFVPPKHDTAIQVKTSLEVATDTVLGAYNPVDSLHQRLRAAASQKKQADTRARHRKRTLQQMDHQLTARIDTLLKGYEQETTLRARAQTQHQAQARLHSTRVIGGIAVGAVLLAAIFLLIIGRDITRSNRYRKQLEEARQRAEELLLLRERLMLTITHDFKAPLGSIMGYADLLAPLTSDGQQQFYLDNLKSSSTHLLKLVTDLLDFHRLDLHKMELHRTPFCPAHLLEEIRLSFQPLAAAKGLELHCHVDPLCQGTFISDPLRLHQVVSNLLSNAVKFTPSGSITLTAGYEERKLLITIADTGRGMEEADCQRIFQEFTRLPGAQGEEGFGLGLSIVHRLVQLLEGTVQVQSALGQGSTFTLRIPAPTVATPAPTAPAVTAPIPVAVNKRVVLIDDDALQLTLTSAMLRQGGVQAVCCQQVDELLDALRTQTFDALLTDLQMPALSGFDLLRLLRASHLPQAATLPVIAVTARSEMQAHELKAYGFAGCLHKPFTAVELLTLLTTKHYHFGALTAFSDDDPSASTDILRSFVQQTRQNATLLRQASQADDAPQVAALAHKMLPLFRLIEAHALVAQLEPLQAYLQHTLNEEAQSQLTAALEEIEEVLAQIGE